MVQRDNAVGIDNVLGGLEIRNGERELLLARSNSAD
jgi:hypothetical protein